MTRAPERAALERARRGGASRSVFVVARALFLPFLVGWFRLKASGRAHRPPSGPLLIAANHRSVLDPIVVGLVLGRPVYYMAKKELFRLRPFALLFSALGAFPVDRGGGDHEALAVAEEILRRGDCLVIFPEGRCVPAGPLGRPRRGVGRLAEATGATVVPMAISGTETGNLRRIPPRRIRVHNGAPLRFEAAGGAVTSRMAEQATDRIWSAVSAGLLAGIDR